MTKEEIVREWRSGHSKAWLVKKEREALKPFADTKELRKSLSFRAQQNVEDALLEWYRREVSN